MNRGSAQQTSRMTKPFCIWIAVNNECDNKDHLHCDHRLVFPRRSAMTCAAPSVSVLSRPSAPDSLLVFILWFVMTMLHGHDNARAACDTAAVGCQLSLRHGKTQSNRCAALSSMMSLTTGVGTCIAALWHLARNKSGQVLHALQHSPVAL